MPPPIGPGSRGKPATRRTLLARRDALTDRERADKSVEICARAAALVTDRCAAGSIVAIYAAKGTEVATAALDAALRGTFELVYPRVIDGARALAFHPAQLGELVASRYGLREPAPASPEVAISDIAAFVVPGLAFDRSGHRVGWGKGHYDATFASARAATLKIGLAFACQVVDQVPREPHDIPLDVVVTE